MKKRASSRRPDTLPLTPKPTKRLLVLGAAMSVTYACGHVLFVMMLGHPIAEVVAHLSMAVFAIPTHAALTAVWDWTVRPNDCAASESSRRGFTHELKETQ